MLNAKLPWLFTALAVASPFLWLWVFLWSANLSRSGSSEYATLAAFVLWASASIICVALFVTLAALSWKPAGKGARDLRKLVMYLFGGGPLLVGCVIFTLFVLNA